MPESPGGCVMDYAKKIRFGLESFCAAFLLLSVLALQVASQDAPNFVGTWQMTMLAGGQGGGQGGQGGNGQGDAQPGDQGEGGGRRGGGGGRGPQTLVIAKDGDNYKVTHKTQRGDKTYDATVSGNAISWTEERPNRDGGTMKIQFKATIDGDALKGTFGGGQFSREFTAKRST
jgi:hypothetical protein